MWADRHPPLFGRERSFGCRPNIVDNIVAEFHVINGWGIT